MTALSEAAAVALTDEQREFLRQCEEDFKDRFMENDTEYVAVRDRIASTPPIEDPWNRHNKDGFRGGRRFRDNRNHDYDRGGGPDRNRDWDRDRDWGDRNHRDRHPYRDRNTGSSGYQRYRPYQSSNHRDY